MARVSAESEITGFRRFNLNRHRSPPLRVAVVGAGPAALSMHLPVLAELRDQGKVALIAICDLERARAADAQRRFGFLAGTGEAAAAIEREDVDAVYIFGSAQLHHALGLAALKCGKHLFVEKPIAPSFDQACQLADAARLNRRIAVGGHNRRFYRAFKLLRDRSGDLGWQYAEAVFHKPESAMPAPFGARTWLGANGIHALDALIFMMGGLPEQLYAVAGESTGLRPTRFSAVMRWRDGGQGVFLCNNDAGARREEYAFHRVGESYRITDTQVLFEGGSGAQAHPISSVGDGIVAEHEAFIEAVGDERTPPHSIEAIAPSLFLGELIESGFNGKVPTAPAALPTVHSGFQREQCILVSRADSLLPSIARLLPHHRLVGVDDVVNSSRERPDIVAAILGKNAAPLTPSTLSNLPRLEIVGVVGLSLARHSPAMLMARGVTVVNASSAYAASVAEFALGLAILARRRAFASHELMRRGDWGTTARASKLAHAALQIARTLRPIAKGAGMEEALLRRWRALPLGGSTAARRRVEPGDLSSASVGLIGWGSISRQLALRLIEMKVRVLVYSEHGSVREIRETGARPASLSESLACDIVSLHRGLTAQTRHFLGPEELSQLRPGAIFINVARGALVDPDALLARLKKGDIFACLDTYENEPPSSNDPLRRLHNVFLTSHIAGGSPDMHSAAAEEVVGKVALYLGGVHVDRLSVGRLSTMT